MIYYNGFRGGVDIIGSKDPGGPRALHLGIERMAETCVQGRGVLIDLHHHFGSERRLVNMNDLQRVMDTDEVTVEAGDMLCLHTGYGQAIMDMGGNPTEEVLHRKYAVLDGRDDRLLSWIASSGISVLIADNFAVEGFPYADRSDCAHYHGLPIHQKCLVDLGIHLGEIWYLTPLARYLRQKRRSRSCLPPPRSDCRDRSVRQSRRSQPRDRRRRAARAGSDASPRSFPVARQWTRWDDANCKRQGYMSS